MLLTLDHGLPIYLAIAGMGLGNPPEFTPRFFLFLPPFSAHFSAQTFNHYRSSAAHSCNLAFTPMCIDRR